MLGHWRADVPEGYFEAEKQVKSMINSAQSYALLRRGQRWGLAPWEPSLLCSSPPEGSEQATSVQGIVPALSLPALGDPSFCETYRVSAPYVSGGMANGIASVALVRACSSAGLLSFFGAAGLSLEEIEAALHALSTLDTPFGMNLIHSPANPQLEHRTVDLYLRHGIHTIEAAAYMKLTLPLVRFRVAGIQLDAQGRIHTPNRVLGKVSRVEVARQFWSPPPTNMLKQLVQEGFLSEEQARWAEHIPVAEDLTAEADSGGHTDNRPALTLFPTLRALCNEMQQQYTHCTLRLGAAGGIGTPHAAAAMFAMGAAYIVVGSVHQSCVESGSSDSVRQMLAQMQQSEVTMAPAADMFEMGVKVQVLKRGTMFAMRASKLYELYRQYPSLEALPSHEQNTLEKQIFQAPLEHIWQQTQHYFLSQDPAQVERAQTDDKHKMALVFRWYLGLSSRWANRGEPQRKLDYQIWCGPAMSAFNAWVKDSHLDPPQQRRIVDVAYNLLWGAAYHTRLQHVRQQGAGAWADQFPDWKPQPYDQLMSWNHRTPEGLS
ncbi:MAG: PfaD family polyunsaturated fatty acid/polyketide biosynthesis protein [Myxococcota bacterium]